MQARRNIPLIFIFVLLFTIPLSGQKWERLDQKFKQHYDQYAYTEALKDAVREVNFSLKHLDSTDLRYMVSYYNVALACHGLNDPESAKSYLAYAYRLMVPYYSAHGAEFASVCELYGRIETELGHHETAANFLTYSRDVIAVVHGKESYQYMRSLYFIADLEMARSGWEQMVAVLEEALEIHEHYFAKNHDYARYANYLGLIYLNNGLNHKASGAFKRALSAYGESGIEKDFLYGHANNNLGLAYYYQSDFENSARYLEQADSIYQVLTEGYSENYMMLINNLASLYFSWGKPDLAREAYRKLESYLALYPGHQDLNYIQGVENTAGYYAETGEPEKAVEYYKKAIGTRESLTPGDQEQLAGDLLLLADLYRGGSKTGLAAETAIKAYTILAKLRPTADPDLVWVLSFLGESFYELHQDQKSLYYYQLAREQIEGAEGVQFAEALPIYNQLGILYHRQEMLKEALQSLEKAHQLDPEEPATLVNLGMLYFDMGNFPEASKMYGEAKRIYGEKYGTESPDYANALIHEIGFRAGFWDFSDEMLEEIREVERICREAGVDSTSRLFIDCMGAYRSYYFGTREYDLSIGYGKRALELAEMSYGPSSRFYAENMLVLADSYVMMGDTRSLSLLYRRAYGIASDLDSLNRENLLYFIESGRFKDYYQLEDYETSRKSLERVIEKDKARFLAMQNILSAQERAIFTGQLDNLVFYNNFLMHFPEDTEVITNALNNRLFMKGILEDTERSQRSALSLSDDTTIIEMHDEYLREKITLANMRSEFGVDHAVLDSIETNIRQLEREISRKVGQEMALADRSFSWKDIQETLGEDEAAVEIVQFNHNPASARDTIQSGYWYIAFIVTRETSDRPGYYMVPMEGREDQINHVWVDYATFMEKDSSGILYDDLWVGIDAAIRGKKTIYVSPDGKYHKLNLESLADQDGQLAINTYRFKYVNSLKELMQPEISYGENQSALLAGDPTFRMALASIPDPLPGETSRSVSEFQSRMFPGTYLTELPGTRTEVDSIGSMFTSQGWDCTILTGREASEDAISKVKNPRVLHLATHGYFAEDSKMQPDNGPEDRTRGSYTFDMDTYAKSCLFFSGAQSTLFYAYDYQKGSADGILTAWEIMEMELDSTELVVLSACDSGLGDVLTSGGIYGLRRAFHLAGAERVLISLWKVDDLATQLLMRKFYSNWLSGMEIDESLVNAKLYMMNETAFTHPRYWAAFILSGI